ncbi:hypothetical protein RclHR1_02270007 [Rhizophagus clarus]|nr:hypothetical protein RclHR1_02270007 [Rhizophagus clarus]
MAKVVKQVISDILTLDSVPVITPQSQIIPLSASSFSLKPTVQPFTPEVKKKKKVEKSSKDLDNNDTIHILTGYHPNLSLGQYVHNILVYNVPAKWENITILDYLKT